MNHRIAHRLTAARCHRILMRSAVMKNYHERCDLLRDHARQRERDLLDGRSDGGRWLQGQLNALLETTWKRMEELRP